MIHYGVNKLKVALYTCGLELSNVEPFLLDNSKIVGWADDCLDWEG